MTGRKAAANHERSGCEGLGGEGARALGREVDRGVGANDEHAETNGGSLFGILATEHFSDHFSDRQLCLPGLVLGTIT